MNYAIRFVEFVKQIGKSLFVKSGNNKKWVGIPLKFFPPILLLIFVFHQIGKIAVQRVAEPH